LADPRFNDVSAFQNRHPTDFGISEKLLDGQVETGILPFGPAPSEGRFAIVTDVGRGMRWTQMALLTRALVSRTAKSCGPDASTPASNWRGYPPMTVTKKPDHRGELEGNR
jgi:hypothetical protein